MGLDTENPLRVEPGGIMATVSFHDVDREVYDRIDVLELHGRTSIWKELTVDDVQLVFFAGKWRHQPVGVPDEAEWLGSGS